MASARLRAVGDQPLDGDLAVAHRRQDAIEVLAGGVAAREQGHLLPVEVRVPEGDRLVHHAHEHVAPAMADEVEAPLHRTGVAGCVEDDIEALAGLLGGASLRQGRHGGDRGDDFRPRGVAVEQDDLGPGEPCEEGDAEADRAGADDKRAVARR